MAKVDFETFQRAYEESQNRPTYGGGADYWKPTAAPIGQQPYRNIIRLMEPHELMIVVREDGTRGRDAIVATRVHYGLGPKKEAICPCLAFFNRPCPACVWVDELFTLGKTDRNLRELAFRVRAKPQFYASVVDLTTPAGAAIGVQTWRFGPELEKKVRNAFFDDSVPAKWRDITDRDAGFNLIIDVGTRPGKNKNNPNETFPSYETVKSVSTPTAVDPVWLDQLRNLLAEEVWAPTPEQVNEALNKGISARRPQGGTVLTAGASHVPTPASLAPTPVALGVGSGSAVAPTPAAFATPTPTPLAPPLTMPGSTPAATPAATPKRMRSRKAAAEPVPAGTGVTPPPVDPLAAAEAEVIRLGTPYGFTTPIRTTREELEEDGELPSCYGRDQELSDKTCQECPAIVWCRAVMMGIVAAA